MSFAAMRATTPRRAAPRVFNQNDEHVVCGRGGTVRCVLGGAAKNTSQVLNLNRGNGVACDRKATSEELYRRHAWINGHSARLISRCNGNESNSSECSRRIHHLHFEICSNFQNQSKMRDRFHFSP
jgi:hypothetical protein